MTKEALELQIALLIAQFEADTQESVTVVEIDRRPADDNGGLAVSVVLGGVNPQAS